MHFILFIFINTHKNALNVEKTSNLVGNIKISKTLASLDPIMLTPPSH